MIGQTRRFAATLERATGQTQRFAVTLERVIGQTQRFAAALERVIGQMRRFAATLEWEIGQTLFINLYLILLIFKLTKMILPWKFTENQFDFATNDSLRKAVILSMFHDNALLTLSTTYPELLPLYTRYHPLHLALVAAYNAHTSSGSVQQGKRLSVSQEYVVSKALLTEEWVPAISLIYKKTTPRYKEIFPTGLKPFNKGGIDEKIAAFNVLGQNIGTDAALTTIKTAVDSNYISLLLARSTQSTAKTTTADSSTVSETARVAAMNMQYRNLGNIMDVFFDTRETMCALVFDLVTLRENPQTIFTGAIAEGATDNILAHTFLAADQFAAKIVGSGSFNLYLSSTATGTDSSPVRMTANIKKIITASSFGVSDYANHRYLVVKSLSAEAASFRVQLL